MTVSNTSTVQPINGRLKRKLRMGLVGGGGSGFIGRVHAAAATLDHRAELAAGPWTFVSPQLTRLLGWTPEEWMADPTLWVRSIHPDDRERVLREEDEPTSGVIDYRVSTKSGELRWIRDDASPVQPRGRARPYWVGTLITCSRAFIQSVSQLDPGKTTTAAFMTVEFQTYIVQ